jgi:NAD(P)-dependent dehydrogenase (short-subunit alcohol dehydrogenase family)
LTPFAGKVAIVTGASRGIGRAIARRLAQSGASLILTARDRAALESLAREAGNAASIPFDLRIPQSAHQIVDFALTTYGRIDIVINNAGATKRGEFLALSDDDWADGFALKFFGAMRLTRCAWPHLQAQSGSVVFISGIGGRTPGREFSIGGSVNAALLSLTKALADLGIAAGVQVNAINPGAIRTDRFQARLARAAQTEQQFVEESGITRVGEPEDVAELVAYLVSPAGRFMHGSVIDIDGGQTKTL